MPSSVFFPTLGGSSSSAGSLSFASVTLTNAQILALGTTPITIVAGIAGKILVPVVMVIEKPQLTGAYGSNVAVQLQHESFTSSILTLTPVLNSAATPWFGIAGGASVSYNASDASKKGKGLVVGNTNNTGGNAANSLTVTVGYITVDSVL